MSQLLTCRSVSKSFGAQHLFTNISLVVQEGDRVGIIGPNGSGKSTLMKIFSGLEDADHGEIVLRRHARVAYLAQEDVFVDEESILANLLAALDGEQLEDAEKFRLVSTILSRAEFPDTDRQVAVLSGGWRKRLAICRALLLSPDLLVLDEPTNHLDIEGILWLEKLLTGPLAPSSFLLVSHDRYFLEHCTNRMIELSSVYPEGTLQVDGNYSRFLEKREEVLAGQQDEETRLANKARQEIEWLRRGPKARATKAKYRVEEAHKLTGDLAELKARNRSQGSVKMDFSSTGRKTKILMRAEGLARSFGDRVLFAGLDITLKPGLRLGLIGRNGCGKSSLMALLAQGDALDPGAGVMNLADKALIVSFTQDRSEIDPEVTLRRALAPDGDSVVFQGRSLHVVSWAKRFLFRPDQLETPVGTLSGGEQARVLLARLMLRQADILLLDEPTNDLDINSLEVLEEALLEFPGAIVLVTHDRYMLDRICTGLLGFGTREGVAFYADYRQWLSDLESERLAEEAPVVKKSEAPKAAPVKKAGRLSYLDQREYEAMDDLIAAAESRVAELEEKMLLPEVISQADDLSACWSALEEAKAELERLYARWLELEEKREEGG